MLLDRVLCLAPHKDDECLGCGGTLLRCDTLHIMYFNDVHPDVPQKKYNEEAENVKVALGCTTSYSKYRKVNRLDQFPVADFITEIEDTINEFKPTTVLVPFTSYNQDHRVVVDAAITAVRIHDRNFIVRNVLFYEQPETHTPAYAAFVQSFFVPIGIEAKLALFRIYESQQRGHRTEDHLKALAIFRGMQAGVPYAEAFMPMRQVYE